MTKFKNGVTRAHRLKISRLLLECIEGNPKLIMNIDNLKTRIHLDSEVIKVEAVFNNKRNPDLGLLKLSDEFKALQSMFPDFQFALRYQKGKIKVVSSFRSI